MVEPPRLQVLFNTRQEMIPIAFKKYAKDKYRLNIIEPEVEEHPRPGPTPRPTFQMLDQEGEIVGFLHPVGSGECFNDEFKPVFDKILAEVESKAKKAVATFERAERQRMNKMKRK